MPLPKPKLLMVTTVAATLRGFLLPFAQHFQQQGWQVDGMASDILEDRACGQVFDNVWPIQWSRNPLDPRNLIHVPRALRILVQKEQYSLVHVHTPVAAFVSRFALRTIPPSQKPAVIYTAHGFHFHGEGHPFKNAIFLGLEKLAGAWTDELVVINAEDEAAAQKHQLVPRGHLHYMPGIGVDLSYYAPECVPEAAAQALRDTLQLQAQDCLLLAIAELIPRKRHRDLLQSLARLQRPDIHLALAGEGPLLAELQEMVQTLHLSKQVHFLGFRPDMPIWIRAAQATVLVSEQEGLPRSVMEALALAVPVIGTEIRGTRELLAEGCGMLVSVGDIDGITQAMLWIADHPAEAREMGDKGQQRMQHYGLDNILKQHEILYQSALEHRYNRQEEQV
jgi:glycosyltransferase involved in cell wall biosynthesis